MVIETRTKAEKCLRTGLDFRYLDFGRWNSLKSNGQYNYIEAGDDYLQKYRMKNNLLSSNSGGKDQEAREDHKIGMCYKMGCYDKDSYSEVY